MNKRNYVILPAQLNLFRATLLHVHSPNYWRPIPPDISLVNANDFTLLYANCLLKKSLLN